MIPKMIPPFGSNRSQENQMFSKRIFDEKENNRNETINNVINNGINNGINGYQQNNCNNKRMKLEVNNNQIHNEIVVNMSQSDDGFHDTNNDNIEDLLNDENADNLCSQACDQLLANNSININTNSVFNQHFNSNYTRLNCLSDHMIIDTNEVITHEDVIMSTNSDQNQLLDSTQGRNKILEARVKKQEEELRQLKALLIQNQKQKQEQNEEHNRVCEHMREEYRVLSAFRDNENRTNHRLIEELSEMFHKSSGIKIEFANDLMQKRKNCPNFSQLKREEFYAPLITTNNITSLSSPNSILVPETQNSNHSVIRSQIFSQTNGFFKHPSILQPMKVSFSCPPEVPLTQTIPTTSTAVISEISSQNDSQTISQSQNPKWEPIRAQVENKFRANREVLSNCYINQQLVGIFPDEWLRNTGEVIDWSQNLIEELSDYNITSVVKFEHLTQFIHK